MRKPCTWCPNWHTGKPRASLVKRVVPHTGHGAGELRAWLAMLQSGYGTQGEFQLRLPARLISMATARILTVVGLVLLLHSGYSAIERGLGGLPGRTPR